MTDVRHWLCERGFEKFADLFEENEIDGEVLLQLTNEDLRELGLALGPRKKLIAAILGESSSDSSKATGSPSAPKTGATPSAPHEAERRQLTVMFVDLVGSTAMAERLDPEEMRDVITTYQNTVAGVVSRYEGMVAKYMGDGVLTYFGWPKAHEDDAERAVRAARALMQAMNALANPAGEVLQARAGIATGLVVVGDLIGEGAAQEEAVVGETPNLAARIQDLAQPGQVAIAETTRTLTGDAFELTELGSHSLKGISGQTQVYAVAGERTAESRLEAVLSDPTSEMIGRGHELGLILERWKQAQKSDGQLLLLTGEAGIGKSRITRAVIEAVAKDKHLRISYQCSPYHTDSSLYPAIQQLSHLAGISTADSNDDKLDKLETILNGTEVQLIAAMLGLAVDDRYGSIDLEPQQQRRQTLLALADELIASSHAQPVLFILEDAHWIDATTLELIELCLDKMSGAKILVLVTARPTFVHRFSGHPIVTQLALNRLSREQVVAIANKLAGGKSLPDDLLDVIAQKTDGVPLFVEELTKTVLESDELIETEDSFQLAGPLSGLAIPATLHDSLMARLDRLQPVKEVAQMAACIGREFEYLLLSQVSPLDDVDLKAALDQLVAAELIFRRGLSSDGSYIFKHALVRDAAYESLLKSRRKAIHGNLLEALEPLEHSAPELLAHHATQANERDKAIDYWRMAGEQARARSAVVEAISHLTQSLTLLLTQPQSKQRDEQELELQSTIGSASMVAYGYGAPATIAAYDRGLELSEDIDRPDLRFPILYGQYVYRYISGGGTDAAYHCARQLLDEAESQTHWVPKMVGHRCAAMIRFCRGEFTSAQTHYQQALELYQPQTDHTLINSFGTDSKVSAQAFLSCIMQLRGFPEQAAKLSDEIFELVRQANHVNNLAYGLFFGPLRFNFCQRNLVDFGNCVAELSAVADEHKLPMWQAYAATQQGWYLSQQGDSNAAIAKLLQGLKGMAASGTQYDSPMALGQLAEVYLNAGRYKDGLDAIDQATAAVERTKERWFEPEIYRLKGEILLEGKDENVPAAKAAFGQSLEAARTMEARWWELRTAVSMARMPGAPAARTAAYEQLQSVYDRFSEGFECIDLQNAKTLLDQRNQ